MIKKITKVTELYERLKEYYNQLDFEVKIPGYDSFTKKLRKELDIQEGERLQQRILYQLLGKYNEMTINALAHNLTLKSTDTSENMCYLFLRITKKKLKLAEKKEILHATCKMLKEEFPKEILFLYYDYDTIVIMCTNQNAKNKIKYNLIEETPIKEEKSNG